MQVGFKNFRDLPLSKHDSSIDLFSVHVRRTFKNGVMDIETIVFPVPSLCQVQEKLSIVPFELQFNKLREIVNCVDHDIVYTRVYNFFRFLVVAKTFESLVTMCVKT